MSPEDLEYLRRRASQERRLAQTAPEPRTAAIHLNLAARYESLVAGAEAVIGARFSVSQPGQEIAASREAVRRSMDLLSLTAELSECPPSAQGENPTAGER